VKKKEQTSCAALGKAKSFRKSERQSRRASARFFHTPSELDTYSRPVAVGIYTGFVLTGVVTTLLGPILPVLSARWALNDTQAGYLFTAQFVGTTGGSLLSGSLEWRRGGLRPLAAGFSLMAIGVAAVAVTSWTAGLASVLCYGLGLGLVIPTTNLLVAEANAGRSAAALNLLNMAWGVGAVTWPLVAAEVVRSLGVNEPLLALALFLAAVAFWMASQRRPAHWRPDQKASPTFALAAGFPARVNQKPFAYNAGLAEKP
jgi:fucose permease